MYYIGQIKILDWVYDRLVWIVNRFPQYKERPALTTGQHLAAGRNIVNFEEEFRR